MRQVLPLKLLLLTLGVLAACVTVNVYFPAAAVQAAADQQIDYVTGRSGSAQPPTNTPPPNSTQKDPSTSRLVPVDGALLAAGRVLELLIPAAHAQANIEVSTPEIRAILQSMNGRFGQLRQYFASGVIGYTADGNIAVRNQDAVPLPERATVARLVAEDNRDRAALYSEIAKANGHPEWETEVRSIYAKRWVERGAESGWYYQNSGGAWVQK